MHFQITWIIHHRVWWINSSYSDKSMNLFPLMVLCFPCRTEEIVCLLTPRIEASSIWFLKTSPVSKQIILCKYLLASSSIDCSIYLNFLRFKMMGFWRIILSWIFSIGVTHSRFEIELFNRFPSLWLTWGLFYGFGIKASATSLWTNFAVYLFVKES